MENNTTITQFPGALDDVRTLEEKAKDYQAEEIASFAPPVWREKGPDQWPTYPVRNQMSRSSCVAETLALMLGIENMREEGRFVEFSAVDIYNRRKNKPDLGMWGVDAMDIATKHGATLELFIPSPGLTDAQADALMRKVSDEQVGVVFKGGGYVQHPFDVERIASYMEANRVNGIAKPVMTWYRFNTSEWTGEPRHNGQAPNAHHSVTALDYGLFNGRKVLITQDSWGLASTPFNGLRAIDQDFMSKHMTFCASIHDLSNNWRDGSPTPTPTPTPVPPVNKPRYNFTRTLNFGETSREVVALQNVLKYEGIFPATVESTGRYLQITAKSVLEFQRKHKVASEAELTYLQGRVVGPKTIKKLNELYA